MLGQPYSDCENNVCAREDCLSDCALVQTEHLCGCKDPLVTELCASENLKNLTESREHLPPCDFQGMVCLVSNNGECARKKRVLGAVTLSDSGRHADVSRSEILRENRYTGTLATESSVLFQWKLKMTNVSVRCRASRATTATPCQLHLCPTPL